MKTIPIKPLSVNDAWKGRRFKTAAYKQFERDVLKLLPAKMEIPEGDLFIVLVWGFSSAASDYDNPVKPFQDVLQKKYNFNDSRFVGGLPIKTKVKKGQEFISFKIISITDAQINELLGMLQ